MHSSYVLRFRGGQRRHSVWMLRAEESLPSLGTVLHQRQGICMSTLVFPSKRKVVHTCQRVGMVRPEPPPKNKIPAAEYRPLTLPTATTLSQ